MIAIGNFTFPSQESVRETVRALVECYPAGSVIDEEDEHEFLLYLFDRHPKRDEKLRAGFITAFFVMRHSQGHKELWFQRDDGTREHFSWRQCVTSRSSSVRTSILEAMRNSTRLRPSELTPPRTSCDICRAANSPLEVDHVHPTFNEIATTFIDEVGENVFTDVMYEDSETHMDVLPFDCDAYAIWKRFHDEHAVLQALCIPCHRAKSADDRKNPR